MQETIQYMSFINMFLVDESEWTEKRIKQLQVLKDIAHFKIIDFISQFEDGLLKVKIWEQAQVCLELPTNCNNTG